MFTVIKSIWIAGNNYYREAVCLSTDAKPTSGYANGSKVAEMDTGKMYRFSAEQNKWLLWQGSGGGDKPSGDYATDAEVDEALDTLFPN